MNPDSSKARELSELEKSGVIMSRMLHELTNHLCILIGGIQLIDSCKDDPATVATSMEAIRDSSKTIGEVIERYASFHREIPNEAGVVKIEEILREIEDGLPKAEPGGMSEWTLNPPADLSALAQVEPRWVRYAVMEVIRQSRSSAGRISVYTPGMSFDGRGLRQSVILSASQLFFHIEVNWHSDKPAFLDSDLFKPSDLNIATLIGIVRWARGQVSYAYLAPGESRFWISLPLADGQSGF